MYLMKLILEMCKGIVSVVFSSCNRVFMYGQETESRWVLSKFMIFDGGWVVVVVKSKIAGVSMSRFNKKAMRSSTKN